MVKEQGKHNLPFRLFGFKTMGRRLTVIASLILAAILIAMGTSKTVLSDENVYVGQTDLAMRSFINEHDNIVIRDGKGGILRHTFDNIDLIIKSNKRLVIDGLCASSCTLYLTLPKANICWTDRARFGFHSAAWAYGKNAGKRSIKANTIMFEQFKLHVRRWIRESKAFEKILVVKIIPYSLLEKDYGDKKCNPLELLPDRYAMVNTGDGYNDLNLVP